MRRARTLNLKNAGQQGMTFIEMMFAIAIGLGTVLAAETVISNTTDSARAARGQHAADTLVQDVMTNFSKDLATGDFQIGGILKYSDCRGNRCDTVAFEKTGADDVPRTITYTRKCQATPLGLPSQAVATGDSCGSLPACAAGSLVALLRQEGGLPARTLPLPARSEEHPLLAFGACFLSGDATAVHVDLEVGVLQVKNNKIDVKKVAGSKVLPLKGSMGKNVRLMPLR